MADADRAYYMVASFYEQMGSYVRHGFVDPDTVCDFYVGNIISTWDRMAPAIAIHRRGVLGNIVLENFEYLYVVAKRWLAQHPRGTYPTNLPRVSIEDKWLDDDLAPADS